MNGQSGSDTVYRHANRAQVAVLARLEEDFPNVAWHRLHARINEARTAAAVHLPNLQAFTVAMEDGARALITAELLVQHSHGSEASEHCWDPGL